MAGSQKVARTLHPQRGLSVQPAATLGSAERSYFYTKAIPLRGKSFFANSNKVDRLVSVDGPNEVESLGQRAIGISHLNNHPLTATNPLTGLFAN